MGTLADSLFTVLMGWVRGLVNALWALFSADHTTALAFLGKNWLLLAGVLIAAGLVIDWIIWLLRWQPYHLWAQRARRLLRIEEPEDEAAAPVRAHAAAMPAQRSAYARPRELGEDDAYDELPLHIDERDAQRAMEQAERAPDEYAYPGMRYDSAAQDAMGSTQRYGAVTQEGPGAAEVARRRAEIEAWQQQMQEEARLRAEAERAAREAEQARLAQEAQKAREAERVRLAQEAQAAREAYETEQARLAQAEYERQLAEYERQKAQYALDLAEYERQKAEYEAALAAQAQPAVQETAHRSRHAQRTYSDYVEGETVGDLPDAPVWPQMESESTAKRAGNKLIDRMAKMIEPEEEQLAARTKLPPRVDMKDAYRPAKTPGKPGRRRHP